MNRFIGIQCRYIVYKSCTVNLKQKFECLHFRKVGYKALEMEEIYNETIFNECLVFIRPTFCSFWAV